MWKTPMHNWFPRFLSLVLYFSALLLLRLCRIFPLVYDTFFSIVFDSTNCSFDILFFVLPFYSPLGAKSTNFKFISRQPLSCKEEQPCVMSATAPSGLSLDINAPIVRPKYRPPSSHQRPRDILSSEEALQTFAKFTAIANKTAKGLKRNRKQPALSSSSTRKSTTTYSPHFVMEDTSKAQK